MSTRLPCGMRVLERGWVSSNSIVFTGADATAVVDTGYARHAAQTVELLRAALDGRPLERIVNTHAHSDHIGGNAALRRAWPGVRITIPAGEARVVRDWDEQALHLAAMDQECERFAFDHVLAHGDLLTLGDGEWRAVASPGHDMASLMLFCEAHRILISADALWENGFGVLFAGLPPDGDLALTIAAQRATLEVIAALKPSLVIPGHGAPFTDAAGALARAHGRLDYFAAEPLRHARYAMKVTLAFRLMIEGRLALADLGRKLDGMSLLRAINQTHFRLAPDAFAAMVATELEKSGAARREGGWLLAAAR